MKSASPSIRSVSFSALALVILEYLDTFKSFNFPPNCSNFVKLKALLLQAESGDTNSILLPFPGRVRIEGNL